MTDGRLIKLIVAIVKCMNPIALFSVIDIQFRKNNLTDTDE